MDVLITKEKVFMKCVKCHRIIDDSDLFCGYCGINQIKFSKHLSDYTCTFFTVLIKKST